MSVDEFVHELQIDRGTDEFEVWSAILRPRLLDLSENVAGICAYGFTEMLNNVIDHAESPIAITKLRRSPEKIEIRVSDAGTGIFRKIQKAAGLANEHDAFLAMAKGRFTTDPERHTGEGIFFTARMFDRFEVLSGSMYAYFESDGNDWLLETPGKHERQNEGTLVIMEIDPASKRSTREIFDRFAPMEGDAFSEIKRTRLLLLLAQPEGGPLVSRSQAKRILARLEQFDEAVLDFDGVPEIGPAFADEIFRVFAREHPSVTLLPLGANESVMRMIVRAREHQSETDVSER